LIATPSSAFTPMTPSVLESGIRNRIPPCQPPAVNLRWLPDEALPLHYQHHNPRQGVDFQVKRLPFEGLQALDPRLIRIPPGACNERHRHAHESIFVVLEGEAEILVGAERVHLQRGAVAFAPRWIVHQSRNLSSEQELLLLAITDFGLTSSVLGDYDRQTRQRFQGQDAMPLCDDGSVVPPHHPYPEPPSDVDAPPSPRALLVSGAGASGCCQSSAENHLLPNIRRNPRQLSESLGPSGTPR
jgi:quercetin dioxygenase-like cupin family protein